MKLKLSFFEGWQPAFFYCFPVKDLPNYPRFRRLNFSGWSTWSNFRKEVILSTLPLTGGWNGDLGLEADMINDPYHPIIYFDSISGNPRSTFTASTIKYGFINARGEAIRTANPQFDTLPDYDFPGALFQL